MRIKGIALLMLAVFITGMIFVASSIQAAETIKLGAILPLSDATGKDASRAMMIAVKQINAAGGVLGRQLELFVEDDGMKPEVAIAAINKLATVNKVDFFVGGVASGITMAMIPDMKKFAKITVWTGDASGKVEQAMEGQDWFFHLHAWDYQQQSLFDRGWQQFGQKHVKFKRKSMFMAYEEGAFGSSAFKAQKPIADANGYTLAGGAFKSISAGGGDYRAALKQAKDAKADMFIWVAFAADALPMLEQAKEIGFVPPVYVGSPPGWPDDFGTSPLSEGVVFYSYWNDVMKSVSKASKSYSDAFNKEYKEAPNSYFGPLGYTNIMIVADAIKKAGSLEKPALIKALEATQYKSPLGDTFIFGKSNFINHQAYALPKIMQYQKGKVQVIWPWELATAKFIYPFTTTERVAAKDETVPDAKKAKAKVKK